ncbi:MAG: GFA family protein [Parasphingorhabdus sp.]|uniref:GFA family protein n=1 Tax=Parasphingorhabdus sp. TaxID=2709688 RepID=UPI0032976C54
MQDQIHKGSCLCGAVKFSVTGALAEADACHCSQCRKQSGHYFASTDVLEEALSIEEGGDLRWYQSSEKVRRGFCGTCGSTLFWDPMFKDKIAVAMGAFDGTTGTSLWSHIFVADKGDYYKIEDGVLQKDQ